MSEYGLLTPGSFRAAGVVDDRAVADAMVRVELGWVRALAAVAAIDGDRAERITAAAAGWTPDLAVIGAATEATGNPVVPMLHQLRQRLQPADAAVVHRGLTSQDVLDTALVLLSADCLTRVRADLGAASQALARLADAHRGSVMTGRTLTQYAVPITFGLKAAQWLAGLIEAADDVAATLTGLPVQCGGAAGTLALPGELTADPVALAAAFAGELGLVWPGLPWHTRRRAVTRIGDTLVATCDALGRLGADVATLSRPEIGELHEAAVAGRGGSSTMPHKQNPILSVVIRSAAMQSPQLGAQLHLAAALAVDERPDGAWHSEWPALRRLLELTVTAASQAAELAAGLEVDADRMLQRATDAAADLLAERGDGGAGDPASYLGATDAFVDTVLARLSTGGPEHA
ncbi:lyase family protein [Allobranchiibius sp. GilTou38]|uniref:lyase family protein n=1 Tax=Allobranchiibius sp. GilTou38 TaxID=2815210 RepID=UPI001AA1B421|nr:lyase family protein [Allobranchiibius sp. GilTou38]MBO1768190.1 3-carboxy-cis,cis-muconate cycloisomerase [Allobranchiibius sp. GilTou38]